MTEISSEAVIPPHTEDIDFTFDEGVHEETLGGEDFDFNLGGDEIQEHGQLDVGGVPDDIIIEESKHNQDVKSNVSDPHETEVYDHPEIGYEEEDGEKPQHPDDQTNAAEQVEDGDEIDYEDGGVDAAEATNEHAGTDEKHEVAVEHHDDIDFTFDTAEAVDESSEHDDGVGEEEIDVVDHDEHDHDESLQEESDEDVQNLEDEDDEEIGEDDEENDSDEGESSAVSLHTGLDQLHGLYPVSPDSVTVTWGDEICPLFKSSDIDDPDSFYLDDLEALDYPLSKFLQSIRDSISSWVNARDEVFIRIDDLGFEFGETTTEALLHQVTFHNLLALHNTLLKNDDSSAPEGLHITLGTRPNCLLRLRDLVSGASTGKGLSTYQQATNSSDGSLDESDDNGAESEVASLNDEVEEASEEDDGDALTSETKMVDKAVDETGTQEPTHEEVALDANHEDADFMEFTNEEDASGPLEEPSASDLTAAQANHAVEQVGDGSVQNQGHLRELDSTVDGVHLDQQAVDLLGDLDYVGGSSALEQDDHGIGHLDPDNGLDLIDLDHQESEYHGLEDEEGHDDDFLDLHGDEDDNATPNTLQENTDNHKVTTDDVETSANTSASATLDHDEIDYEDHDITTGLESNGNAADATSQAPASGAQDGDVSLPEPVADDGLDEIDWDDEGKNGELASTPATVTGKRTRDVDEEGGELIDALPDSKRHRTGTISE